MSPRPVLWVASECAPLATTGGLGEVVGSLAPRLRRAGWPITLLLPLYRELSTAELGLRVDATREWLLPLAGAARRVRVLRGRGPDGLPLLLVDCPELFDRPGLYGDRGVDHPDNDLRFALLGRVALQLLREGEVEADLLHLHDWPTAPLALGVAVERERERRFEKLRTLLTLHNLAYQGPANARAVEALELSEEVARRGGFLLGGRAQWLRAGIRCADGLSTVSPAHAAEILRPPNGHGLEEELNARAEPVVGILNGLDSRDWDPSTDPALVARFDADDLSARRRCRRALRRELGLDDEEQTPLVAFLGRLAWQKGVDVVLDALEGILDAGAQLALLGDGDPKLEARLREAARRHPGRVGAFVGFDRPRSRRFLAGIDLLLIPSRFEPCGLTQMQAMRYGAVPVAHAVGGLRSTIVPVREGQVGREETGFLFESLDRASLSRALREALGVWRRPERWHRLQRNGMRQEWSWEAQLPAYEALYRRTLAAEPRRRFAAAPVASFDWGPSLPEPAAPPRVGLRSSTPRRLHAHWELPPGLRGPLSVVLVADDGERVLRREVGRLGDLWCEARPDRRYRVALRDAEGTLVARSEPCRTARASAASGGERPPSSDTLGSRP